MAEPLAGEAKHRNSAWIHGPQWMVTLVFQGSDHLREQDGHLLRSFSIMPLVVDVRVEEHAVRLRNLSGVAN
jgi:hypothetical protein